MLNEFSTKGQLSFYDIYSGIRDVAIIALSFLVTNIGMVEQLLRDWNINPFYASFIVYFLIELGRKYNRDYKKEVVEEATVTQLVAEIEALDDQ